MKCKTDRLPIKLALLVGEEIIGHVEIDLEVRVDLPTHDLGVKPKQYS